MSYGESIKIPGFESDQRVTRLRYLASIE